MLQEQFIGREKEIKQLNLLLKKRTASLVVVKGRRRIGKSRLIQEFGKNFTMYNFSGLPPREKTTVEDQLKEFGWQLGKALNKPAFQEQAWNSLFLHLANSTREGRIIILFDEITWMGSKDPDFLGKLKNAWDLEFKKNPQLILILCGSVSAWIDRNILSSTGFLGRISLRLTIEELSIYESNQFLADHYNNISAMEKFKILSVTGGVPKYLEEIQPSLSAEENIKNLIFDPSGLLFNEFDQIFTNLFDPKSKIFKCIIECLVDGHSEFENIRLKLGLQKSGVLSDYLDELIKSGFIRRDYTWDLKTCKKSKLSRYRVSDNYLRFYLKYVMPYKDQIAQGSFAKKSLSALPGWEGKMGLQFENLVLNNRHDLIQLLNINTDDIIYDNPFFQHQTTRQHSCQIDYLIQTKFNTLYVCEIKFSKYPINIDIISEIQAKIDKIKSPKRVSFRPVLIHVNGVHESVIDARYFAEIVDFGDLLNVFTKIHKNQ